MSGDCVLVERNWTKLGARPRLHVATARFWNHEDTSPNELDDPAAPQIDGKTTSSPPAHFARIEAPR
jgi:hypothetical protein